MLQATLRAAKRGGFREYCGHTGVGCRRHSCWSNEGPWRLRLAVIGSSPIPKHTLETGQSMKLYGKLLLVGSAATVVVAATVIPVASSQAAGACAAAWNAATVYVKDNAALQNGHNYTAKWWTQNES